MYVLNRDLSFHREDWIFLLWSVAFFVELFCLLQLSRGAYPSPLIRLSTGSKVLGDGYSAFPSQLYVWVKANGCLGLGLFCFGGLGLQLDISFHTCFTLC